MRSYLMIEMQLIAGNKQIVIMSDEDKAIITLVRLTRCNGVTLSCTASSSKNIWKWILCGVGGRGSLCPLVTKAFPRRPISSSAPFTLKEGLKGTRENSVRFSRASSLRKGMLTALPFFTSHVGVFEVHSCVNVPFLMSTLCTVQSRFRPSGNHDLSFPCKVIVFFKPSLNLVQPSIFSHSWKVREVFLCQPNFFHVMQSLLRLSR